MKKSAIGGIVAAVLVIGVIAAFFIIGNQKMGADDITYDGEALRWDAPLFSDSYDVSINGGEAKSSDTEEMSYNANGDFKVSITVHRKLDFIFKEYTVEKEFKVLPTVDGISYSDGKITWNAVDGAASYTVEIDGSNAGTASVNEFAYTSAGSHKIRVMANGPTHEYYSRWSDQFNMRILEVPENIIYDSKTGTISWRTVTGANGYTVLINNEEKRSNGNMLVYSSGDEDFSIKVRADGNETANVFASPFSEEKKYVYLDTVDTIYVSDGILKWNSVEGAAGYYLRIDGREPLDIKGTEYPSLGANISHTIELMPYSDNENYYSNWSAMRTVNILASPTISISSFDNEETIITWADNIANASGYQGELYLNGTLIDGNITFGAGTGGKNEFKNSFSQEGVYTFRIKAVGASGYNDSRWSDAATITRLGRSDSHTVTDDLRALNSTTQVQFTGVGGAKSYTVKVNDVTIYSNLQDRVFTLGELRDSNNALLNGKSVTVSISANSYKENERSLYLGSAQPYSFTVNKLAVPENFKISDNYASWNSVENANGYILSIGSDSGELSRIYIERGITSVRVDLSESGNYIFKIRAMGNGSDVISSDNDNGTNVTKLSAPKNVKVENRLLTWTAVSGAEGYYIKIGDNINQTINSSVTSFDLTPYADLTAKSVTIYAIGNGGADGSSTTIDSATSAPLIIQKLGTPTEVKVTNSEITWTAVPNASGYIVYIDGVGLPAVGSGTTSIPHASRLTEAKTYRISVMAVGNGSVYFNGDNSGIVSVTKLPAPVVTAESNGLGTLVWTPNSSASEVKVIFNSNEYSYNNNVGSFEPVFNNAGTYTVRVRFIGDGTADLSSPGYISSDEGTFTIYAEQLRTPTIEYEFTGDGNVKIYVATYGSESIADYIKWRFNNGSDSVSDMPEMVYPLSVGTVEYKLTALGGFFADGKYYLNSRVSNTLSITKLSQPTDLRLSAGSDASERVIKYTMNQSMSTKVGVYSLNVVYRMSDGSSETRAYTSNSTSCTIDWIDGTVSLEVTITASGNAPGVVSSDIKTETIPV